MKLDYLKIHSFKNLEAFEIDFQETSLITVIIGKNGTGKSNLFEALVTIFSALTLPSGFKGKPPFKYFLRYWFNDNKTLIEIDADPERKTGAYHILIDGVKKSFAELVEKEVGGDMSEVFKYLPRYTIAYYSGMSTRLKELFKKQEKHFLDDLLQGKSRPLRPLLYARLMHSHFVLLSFFLYPDAKSRAILKSMLGIIDIESVLFVLKTPVWNKNNHKIPGGDHRFWYARGVVQNFLSKIYEKSLAPIRVRADKKENLYLYFPDIKDLKEIIEQEVTYHTPNEFFKALESMDVSDLILEVKTVVKKIDVKGTITYKELSEGEQQLIMVLGLMKFTKDKESLYLLDEPDTHLNPAWKYTYLDTLRNVIGSDEKTSQIIMSTHDPLSFFGLDREQVILFEKSIVKKSVQIKTRHPEQDPNTMSVNAILTGELFGLKSVLSPSATEDMERRRTLFIKKNVKKKALTVSEEVELTELSQKLSGIISHSTTDDQVYNQFMEAMNELNSTDGSEKIALTPSELRDRKAKAAEILKSLLKQDNAK